MYLSLVRHMSHLFQFLTQTLTLNSPQAEQHVHLVCMPSRISLFCIDPDDFQEIIWNTWQICCWWFKSTPCLAPFQFCLGPICLTSPSTFLNYEIHICTVILLSDRDLQWYITGYFSHIFSETPITILRQNDIRTSNYVV